MITAALAATRGNQIRAADLLGLNRNTLRKKIRDLGIKVIRTPEPLIVRNFSRKLSNVGADWCQIATLVLMSPTRHIVILLHQPEADVPHAAQASGERG